MKAHVVIDHLTRALMAAYQALPAQEQEGPLGDQIVRVLQEAWPHKKIRFMNPMCGEPNCPGDHK